MLSAIAVVAGLSGLVGGSLALIARRMAHDASGRPTPAARVRLVDAIDALLPQTQCTQCGKPGCRPYAEALADGASLDLCPPGGSALVLELSQLLQRAAPGDSIADDAPAHPLPPIARIDETRCIGCALCLPACPVDAIVGAVHRMHSIIASECTGCGLCLPPCPVDCITLTIPNPAASAEPRTPATFVHRPPQALPCIGCGRCESACPVDLAPMHLYALAAEARATPHQLDALRRGGLDACVECGACDAVCPSRIGLRGAFHDAKAALEERDTARARAKRARRRFESREMRRIRLEATASERRANRLAARLGHARNH